MIHVDISKLLVLLVLLVLVHAFESVAVSLSLQSGVYRVGDKQILFMITSPQFLALFITN